MKILSATLTYAMNTHTPYDWLTKAAAMAANDEDVEKAFADMAYGFVQNKAGRLMRAPHMLGFEVVWKNESNTRLIGIFAFRVEKELYYVPVFFTHGDISGSDLLYNVAQSKFCALTEERVGQILSEQSGAQLGVAVPTTRTTEIPSDFSLARIAYPGGHAKLAADASAMFVALQKEFKLPGGDGSILKHALAADDGHLARSMHALVERDPNFASLLAHSPIAVEDMFPSSFEKSAADTSLEKQAAAPPEPAPFDLPTVVTDVNDLPTWTEDGLRKLAADGMVLANSAKEAGITPLYRPAREEWISPSTAGLFDILRVDGELAEALLLPFAEQDLMIKGTHGSQFVPQGDLCCGGDGATSEFVLVWLKDKTVQRLSLPKMRVSAHGVGTNLLGHVKDDMLKEDADVFETAPKAGKSYIVVLKDGLAAATCHPFKVVSVTSLPDGLKRLLVRRGQPRDGTVIWNPNTESCLEAGVLGSDCLLVEVATEVDDNGWLEPVTAVRTASEEQATSTIYNSGKAGTVDLIKSGSFYTLQVDGEQALSLANAPQVARHLLQSMNAEADCVMDLIKSASEQEDHSVRRLYLRQDVRVWKESLTKHAGALMSYHTPPLPAHTSYPENLFGTPTKGPRADTLPVNIRGPVARPARYGDSHDPANGVVNGQEESWTTLGIDRDQLSTIDPAQLKELADSRGQPSIFEHKLLGTLVHMEDAVSQVDRAIGPLEDAVDALGRLHFLHTWRPQDFEDAFGKDDMLAMGSDLLSEFKSLDRVLLSLQKRSRRNRERARPALR